MILKVKGFFKAVVLVLAGFRDLLIRYLPRMRKRSGFAFLVHPRDVSDTYKKWPFLRLLPESWVKWFLKRYWPIIVSEIKEVKDRNENSIKGWLIAIPTPAEQMLEDRELAKKKIIQAIRLAEKLGSEIVGLGALTSSITGGGVQLLENSNIHVTSGNTLTAGIIVKEIIKIKAEEPTRNTLSIVGATGSIGTAVALILFEKGIFEKMILVGRTPEHLEDLRSLLNRLPSPTVVDLTNEISKIKESDIVVVTTSARDAIIKSEFLKHSSIVYDITQPRNIPEQVIKERKDVIFIEGGIVRTKGINYHFNFGIPGETAFACLAETILLVCERGFNNDFVGRVKTEKVLELLSLAERYNFQPLSRRM